MAKPSRKEAARFVVPEKEEEEPGEMRMEMNEGKKMSTADNKRSEE